MSDPRVDPNDPELDRPTPPEPMPSRGDDLVRGLAEATAAARNAHTRSQTTLEKVERLAEMSGKQHRNMLRELSHLRQVTLETAQTQGEMLAELIKVGSELTRVAVRVQRLEHEDVTLPDVRAARAAALSDPEIVERLARLDERQAAHRAALEEARREAREEAKREGADATGRHELAETKRQLDEIKERNRHYFRVGVGFLLAAGLAVLSFIFGRGSK
jgi:hypothetical protein